MNIFNVNVPVHCTVRGNLLLRQFQTYTILYPHEVMIPHTPALLMVFTGLTSLQFLQC